MLVRRTSTRTTGAMLEVEIPAGNGVGTARAIARAYSAFAEGGAELGITPETFARLTAPPAIGASRRTRCWACRAASRWASCDRGREVSFGSSRRAFGTPGAGGSFALRRSRRAARLRLRDEQDGLLPGRRSAREGIARCRASLSPGAIRLKPRGSAGAGCNSHECATSLGLEELALHEVASLGAGHGRVCRFSIRSRCKLLTLGPRAKRQCRRAFLFSADSREPPLMRSDRLADEFRRERVTMPATKKPASRGGKTAHKRQATGEPARSRASTSRWTQPRMPLPHSETT